MGIEAAVVLKVVKAVATYVYNTDPDIIVKALFPDAHPSYIQEKVAYLATRGIVSYLGTLDQQKFSQFCDNVTSYANSEGIF